MPQIDAPHKEKPKKEEAQRVDKATVVSAYSEEGQTRIKESKAFDRKLKVLTIVLLGLGFIAIALFVILSYVYNWF